MEDKRIIELYFARDERAIEETRAAYGNYVRAVAGRILNDAGDAAECENDTYLGVWNAIPPAKPETLRTFCGKIARNLSLKKLRDARAEKRGGGETELALDELENLVSASGSIDDAILAEELAGEINRYLATLDARDRDVFVCRYWHFDSIKDIAERFGFSESKVKMTLMRTRDKLAMHLKKEGMII